MDTCKKISKLSPLAALNYGMEINISKMHRFYIFSKIFGIYGELGRKSIYARRKELRTSTLSLAFAFLALTGLLNIEAISGISTQFTYFERFRDKWDMTIDITDSTPELLQEIKNIEGIRDCIAHQKVLTDTTISEAVISKELRELGISNLTEKVLSDGNGGYLISVPIY